MNKYITDESIVHGLLILAFCVDGFLHRFSVPHVIAILGVLLIHYRRDALPAIENKKGANPAAESVEYAQLKFDVEMLQEKVTQLNALIAFKTGLGIKTPQPPAQGQK
jgi:hypothetical protein